MKIWVNAQLSPALADWIAETFGVEAWAVRTLSLRDASDSEIFMAAKQADAIVMTKDSDFIDLVNARGGSAKGDLAHLWEHDKCASQENSDGGFTCRVETAGGG